MGCTSSKPKPKASHGPPATPARQTRPACRAFDGDSDNGSPLNNTMKRDTAWHVAESGSERRRVLDKVANAELNSGLIESESEGDDDNHRGHPDARLQMEVHPASGPIRRLPTKGDGELVCLDDCVVALVHAVRESLPLCFTAPGSLGTFGAAGFGAADIRSGIGRSAPVSDEELPTTERLTHVSKFDLPGDVTVSTLAPAIFMRILAWCDVDVEDYLQDWCAAASGPSPSRGKSSSTFLQSLSGRFLIKTINYEEHQSLSDSLPSYYAYLMQNPNSLLPRHFGAFFVKRRQSKCFFTVTPNIIPHPADFSCSYDLKGSTYRRAASERDAALVLPLLKDNDLVERGEKFCLCGVDRKLLVVQLEEDVAWLESQNRMDYSLFVGVCHKKPSDADPCRLGATESSPPPAGPSGGRGCGYAVLRDPSSTPILHAGIIDILQDYNIRKQVAHTLKTTVAESNQLSTVPADVYGKRFISFLSGHLVKLRDATLSFFLDPHQIAATHRSALHRDDAVGAGDVVGRTENEVLTLDIMSPAVKSIVVVSEVRRPVTTRYSEEQAGVSSFANTNNTNTLAGSGSSSTPRSPLASPHNHPRSGDHEEDDDEEAGMLLYTCNTGNNVPVNVVGPVRPGDVLVPSGRSDGTAVAVPRSCPTPPYALGVVENVPVTLYEPDPASTKYTVVRASVGEHHIVDPIIPWQQLLTQKTHGGYGAQAMWVEVNDYEAKALTRSCILNPTGVTLVKLKRVWMSIDWLAGVITRSGEATPVRCADPSVERALAAELHRRRVCVGRQVLHHVSSPGAKKLLCLPTACGHSVAPRHDVHDSGEEPSRYTPRTAHAVRCAERSLGGWLRGWIFRGDGPTSTRHATEAMAHYRANLRSTAAPLMKGKGVFKRILTFLVLTDLGRASLVCRQWRAQVLSRELWEYVLDIYRIPNEANEEPCIDIVAKLYPQQRRMIQFKYERWLEQFGLRFPAYGQTKQALLKMCTQLDLYELIFQRHEWSRTLLDFALFSRTTEPGMHCTVPDSQQVWEKDRAVQTLWPALRRQWLRSSLTLKFDMPDDDRVIAVSSVEELAALRRQVVFWLQEIGITKFDDTWEGSSLLVTFLSRSVLNAAMAAHQELTDPLFVVRLYTTMRLCRRVVEWSTVKKRFWLTFPGASSPLYRPVNKSATAFPTRIYDEYCSGLKEAAVARTKLTDVFEQHLFPAGSGVSVPMATPGVEEKCCEMYEVADSHMVKLPGQVFPMFLVTSECVLAVLEVNAAVPKITEEDARKHPMGHLRVEGHGSLEVYLLCEVGHVRCSADALRRLLFAIDIIAGGQSSAALCYSVAVEGQSMPDGSSYTQPPLWVCENLVHCRDEILDVLTGRAPKLDVLGTAMQESMQNCLNTDITHLAPHHDALLPGDASAPSAAASSPPHGGDPAAPVVGSVQSLRTSRAGDAGEPAGDTDSVLEMVGRPGSDDGEPGVLAASFASSAAAAPLQPEDGTLNCVLAEEPVQQRAQPSPPSRTPSPAPSHQTISGADADDTVGCTDVVSTGSHATGTGNPQAVPSDAAPSSESVHSSEIQQPSAAHSTAPHDGARQE